MNVTPRIAKVAALLNDGYVFNTSDDKVRIRAEKDEAGTTIYVQRGIFFRVYSTAEVAAAAALLHKCAMPFGVSL